MTNQPSTSTTSDQHQTDPPQPQRGRPPALDTDCRRRIVDLLKIGCSRRVAARCVGCSPSTITRTAGRDAQFADQIANAESNLEVRLLENVARAAQNDRYWRAASWLLERKYPLDYKPRDPRLYTPQEVIQLFVTVLMTLREEITPPQREQIIKKLGDLLLESDPCPPTPDS